MIYGEIVIPSSSSYKEMSKFPEGSKATETATSRGRRLKCEMGRETEESKVGLQAINEDGEGERMACFKEGESGRNGLMEAIEVASVVSQAYGSLFNICFLAMFFQFLSCCFSCGLGPRSL